MATDKLIRELRHPNNFGSIHGVRFSADGMKLIAGDYPGGVVVVWDVSSGKQLVKIETGEAYRGSAECFSLSPDWRTLFVSHFKQKIERIEVDGTPMRRWGYDGEVRAWDLATGKLSRTYKHSPPRGIIWMQLSPNGAMFVTVEMLSGVAEGSFQGTATLWDVKSGLQKSLGEGLQPYGLFSPNSGTFAQAIHVGSFVRALKMFEFPSVKEKWSVAVKASAAWVDFAGFSPDGRLLAVNYRAFDKPKQLDDEHSRFKLLDAATGREIAELAEEKNATFASARFAPDGRTLVAMNWHTPARARAADNTRKLYLFRLGDKQPPRTLVLGQQAKGQWYVARDPAFSLDSKWLAVITQLFPNVDADDRDPLNVPPARVHLIDVAAGEIRETLACPPGFAASACFSPDGKTLATSGHGRVLLWDVSKLKLNTKDAESR